MVASLKVNLHCHSNLSDGELSPEALAALLSRSGVQVASLTDHDTVEGVAAFREIIESRGVRHITGLELTAGDGGPLHLLAYGFDPESPALAKALQRSRQSPDGSGLPVEDAIDLIHRAGGGPFWPIPCCSKRRRAGWKSVWSITGSWVWTASRPSTRLIRRNGCSNSRNWLGG